ncbi:cobyric acid synthase [Granulicoccus phenolivorans]|uniref:cobyric acid synthase n=1 Tax=Granulicoccus phenolivorans TaxID=266854 RepID=UPI000422D90E|nr:cobyric acid synthase [Granulicoccus phenolivorans]
MVGLLLAGTSSDAGKSLITAGLCRLARDRGLSVAPFKAQNMSNNSMVCADGSEIGRAQYLQAIAAGVEPSSAMNPVLLKPGSDRRSFIVVRGRPAGTLESGEYAHGRAALAAAAFEAYAELAAAHDLVLCEGAGSPAEINLRAGDYVNFGLARRFDLPVVLLGDIDRGGVLAALYGTWALVEPADRNLLAAFLINKFRGDEAVLTPGLTELTRRTGVPVRGVIPWLADVWLDGEDTLEVGRWGRDAAGAVGVDGAAGAGGVDGADGADVLRVAVVRFPRLSNATDVDALAAEPGVRVEVTTDPAVCAAADLVVLPGSRSTLTDLAWLRGRGLAEVLTQRHRLGRPVLGICGGYQMLGATISDEIEAPGAVPGAAPVPGLGLLPVTTRFAAEKVLGRPLGSWAGQPVRGYEIHHGRVTPAPGAGTPDPFLDGVVHGQTWGTLWHGIMENDGFRRAWLTRVAEAAGSPWRPRPGAPAYGERREAMLDRVAAALAEHVAVDELFALAR